MHVHPVRITGAVFFIAIVTTLLIAGITSAAGSDIVGTRIVLPTPLTAGDPVEVQDFLKNQGTMETGPFDVLYYLSPDLSDSDDGILVGTWEISGMKSGSLKSGNTTLSIPGTTMAGEYYLIRKIDPEGDMSDEESSNNIQISRKPVTVIQKIGPGVRGTGTLIPADADAGDMMPVSVILENVFDTEASPVTVYFFLSASETLSSSKVNVGFLLTDVIPPGEQQEVEGEVMIPEDTPAGNYYFFTSLIPPEDIVGPENASAVWFNTDMIRISSAKPVLDEKPVPSESDHPLPGADIVFLETEIPDEAFIGDSFAISDAIKNNGGSAANIVRVEYGLSPVVSGKDSRHIGWWTTMNLGPGQMASGENQVGVPSEMKPGLYYLTKKITVTATPPEQNAANNWWVSNHPVEIRYNPADPIPELTHVKTIWPQGQPGDVVQITDTITNIGRGCANDISVAYYISPYPDFDPGTAEYLDVWKLDSLCPAEQMTNAISVTIPQYLKNGEYYWYSIIDPCSFIEGCGEGIPEPDKSNNFNIGTMVIGPCTFCG